MRLPAIASLSAQLSRHLILAVTFSLPAFAAAQGAPALNRLLFEVGPPADSATSLPAGDASPGIAETPAGVESATDGVTSSRSAGEEGLATAAAPSEEETAAASIASYERAVAELEQTEGPFASGLSERLQTLGDMYEHAGDHQAAIAAYEKAVHILRVNGGLFTLDQETLVRRIIRNYQAMNDYREAGNRQEYLYYIKQKNYEQGHPEMIQAMFDWADWNVQAYYRELEEANSSRFSITTSAGPYGGDLIPVVGPNNTVYYVPRNQGFSSGYTVGNSLYHPGMGMQYMLDPRLRTARDLYQSIAEQVEAETASSQLLPETERRLANISYIVKQEMDRLESALRTSTFFAGRGFRSEQNPEVSRGYIRGRDSLTKVLEAVRENPESTPVQVAAAIIDLGDWQLAYERPQAAYENYREAWQVMAGAGMTEAEIDAVFAPTPAVEIPIYATHRHSRATLGIPADAELAYRGYIDVRLDVDRYGNVRRPRVEDSSPNTHQDVRQALLDHLRSAKLRPRVAAGEAVGQADMVVRYYYSY